jgi:hypothetical protein
MPLSEESKSAPSIIDFGSDGNAPSKAARISYDVPLPGSYSFDRLVPIEWDSATYFTESARKAGRSLTEVVGGQQRDDGSLVSIDKSKLIQYYKEVVAKRFPVGPPVLEVGPGQLRARLETGSAAVEEPLPAAVLGARPVEAVSVRRSQLRDEQIAGVAEQVAQASTALEGLAHIPVLVPGLGQALHKVIATPKVAAEPRIALIETFQISSFLGDYGLGRTINTFSLLPGERTTITVDTWRTDTVNYEQSTSIFDSADSSAETRWANELEQESGNSSSEQGGWAFSVGVEAGGGFNIGIASASAKVETGFSANHQESRAAFSTASSRASASHAAQCNNSRQQAVSSGSSAQSSTGSSTTTTRELVNTNLRRVLNFVFRELNQSYEVVTSLRDVRLAYYNGHPGSASIVPLSQLRSFLERHVVAAKRDEVAVELLSLVAQCADVEGKFHVMLEVGTLERGHWRWADAPLGQDGKIAEAEPLKPDKAWRIKPGPIGQQAGKPQVGGVVTARTTAVLRTDTVVIEALLGQADALDPYATALQSLDLRQRAAEIERLELENARIKAGITLTEAIAEEDKRETIEALLGERPEISVLGLEQS